MTPIMPMTMIPNTTGAPVKPDQIDRPDQDDKSEQTDESNESDKWERASDASWDDFAPEGVDDPL